jgi:coronin-1B/1C/6
MSRVVRSSKYRHVFGTPAKKEHTYDGIKPSKSAWDSNKVAASSKFIGCIWDASGGGAFAVLDINKKGKLGTFPLVTGHTAEVLDIDFSPFNDNIIASVAEDCYGKIWAIPDGGLSDNLNAPAQVLQGHKRKVGTLNFNPIANNILATTANDSTVKVWDIETGQVRCDVGGHPDIIQSSGWDYFGKIYSTASKDKKLRTLDPRAGSIVSEVEAHVGGKGMRLLYLGRTEKLFSMGFSKTSERQFSLWDPRNLATALRTESIDNAAGILMPFYDPDINLLFLAGKGDGNIRYYELVDEAPYIHFLSEFKSASPQRGMGWVPKLAMDLASCEIARMLKLGPSAIEPISFTVPRKSDIFQDDLYPPTFSGEPSLTADAWASGSNAEPKLVNLGPNFVAPKQVQSSFKAVETTASSKSLSPKELEAEVEKLRNRVSYLEVELSKKDARIKELEKS